MMSPSRHCHDVSIGEVLRQLAQVSRDRREQRVIRVVHCGNVTSPSTVEAPKGSGIVHACEH